VKTLITANDVKQLATSGKKIHYIEANTIITPAAKDAAHEWGVTFEVGTAPMSSPTSVQQFNQIDTTEKGLASPSVDPAMISKLVMEVMARLPQLSLPPMEKVVDPETGFALIKGSSVVCEKFNTGNPNDKVGIREILTIKESPNMAAGFMTIEDSTFDFHLKYDEFDYVVEGTLEFIVNGKKYTGHPGDIFFIPMDTKVTFTTPNKCRYFFVTYPANWAELANYQK
jgi:ethanolamine utilization protein EutQ